MSTTSPVDTRRTPRARIQRYTYKPSSPTSGGYIFCRDRGTHNEHYDGTVYSRGCAVEVWAQASFADYRIWDGKRVHVFSEDGIKRTRRGLRLRAHALAKSFARGEW